ncbi:MULTISPECIES: DedA family protein [Paenibacillus]|uniref:DedA family protein n=1 Tax=Paenibacillus TaxID=44249 RepID=UPI000838DD1C|nr:MULTISPECIES: DedA family protein [Paenibacillus]GIP22780.1 alkaline phosphatase [Paenibacillus sp. J22TS3]
MEWISNLFDLYGYYVLFLGLFAESVALPFPGELAMAISGHLSSGGSFNLPLIIVCSYTGAITGTLLTYALGYKLGTPFFEKYGKYFFLNQKRLDTLSVWFDRYGSRLIFISYFVPGLRHFTGYFSGILRVKLRTFLIYNCTGGFLWVLTYVTIGKILGPSFERLLHLATQYTGAAVAVAGILLVLFILFKRNKEAILGRFRRRGRQKG